MFYFRPFNFFTDGLLTRNSKGWWTLDDGSLRSAGTDEKRLVSRPGGAWIWLEGARENFLLKPLEVFDADWNTPAAQQDNTDNPLGADASIGYLLNAEVIEQEFLAGAQPVLVTWSAYVKPEDDAGGLRTTNLRVTNAVPGTDAANTNVFPWQRVVAKARDVSGGGAKTARLAVNYTTFVWGCVVEAGPAYASSARFASQPILDTVVRDVEIYNAGLITQELVDRNPRRIRVVFEPDWATADVVNGNEFVLVYVDGGSLATSIGIQVEGAGGIVRCRAGRLGTVDTVVSLGVTWSAGQRITLTFELDTGRLTVAGATTGNGDNDSAPVMQLAVGASVFIGSQSAGVRPAFALVSPLEVAFDSVTVVGFDQLSLNSARVTFSTDVLQFDHRGFRDALNPAHYTITGTPGLPRVQYVDHGDTDADVVLFFDDDITPGSIVRMSPHDIVSSGIPIGVDQGEQAIIDMAFQTGNVLDTVLRAVYVGPAVGGSFETIEYIGDPLLRPGINGLEIVIDDVVSPYVVYHYISFVDTVADMEATIAAVIPHLMTIAVPGTSHVFVGGESFVMDMIGGASAPVYSFIAFGGEVNITAQPLVTYPRVDIANPQTERDAPQGGTLGTFQVSDGGDLLNDYGRAYLRKRILRRLTTQPGAFFHLSTYGLAPPMGGLIGATSLRRLRVDVELQVRQEPGVLACRATVSELSPGVVAVKLRVQDDNGSFELEGALDFNSE